MSLTMTGFGIGFVVGGFLVLSLVWIRRACKHATALEDKLLRACER
jgi:hypothetical protein